jgi:Ni,Fe-hydrogenase I cytochrome b subunit
MNTRLQRYKVWDRTTRVFHWINAATVIALIAIGILILNTDILGIKGEAKILLKSVHVYIGYVFVLNLVWRLIWAFMGSHYARWRQILPLGKNYLTSLKRYLLNSGNERPYLGHNPVARLIISLFFLLLSLQAATGLILAGTDLYMPPLGGYFSEWVTEGDQARLNQLKPGDKSQVVDSAYKEMRSFRKPVITIHIYGFYTLLILVFTHVLGVIITEIREKNGLISAMIIGEKVLDDTHQDE